jgi:hypothetical protein
MTLITLVASLALAQDADLKDDDASYLQSSLYRPPIESDGMLWTEDAGISPDGLANTSISANYIFDPLFMRTDDDDAVGFDSESQAMRLDVQGAAAVSGFQLGADIPLFLANDSFDNPFYQGDAGVGDISLDLKGGIIESGEDNPVNVALGARLIFPTASDNLDEIGIETVAWEARVIADAKFMKKLNVAGNVGTRGLPDEIVDIDGYRSEFFFRAGVGYDLVEDIGFSLDVAGAFDYGLPVDESESAPIQGLLGAYARVANSVVLRGGVGSGLLPGLESPAMRAMVGITWEPMAERTAEGVARADVDADTVGRADVCPDQAEDLDGFQDADGCPDVDNDSDNVADLTDACPDAFGRMLPNAHVQILDQGRQVEEGTGSFDAQLVPGSYTLTAGAEGYRTLKTTFRVYPEDVVQVSAVLTREGEMLPEERALQPATEERDLQAPEEDATPEDYDLTPPMSEPEGKDMPDD